MAVAQVVDARVNPNNPAQRVVLWSNGRTDVYGAPAITDGPQFYDRPDQPVVVAIWISNWSTMAGYMLDKHGGFHTFGGAPAVGTKSTVRDTDTHYVVTGVPYLTSGLWYWDWQWDPDVPGRGIALDVFGNLHPFGGATAPPRSGRRWASPLARKLAVRWKDAAGVASMRAYTLGYDGSINPDYAGTVAVTSPHRWTSDMAVDLVVTDWDTGSGYMLDRNGGTWAFGNATGTYSPGYKLGADVARCLEVISPADPLSFWRVGPGGQETEWTWSTPPTITAGGADPQSPAATVTDTTRPVLAWSYSDQQSDAQARWELFVFTEAFAAAHSMTDPDRWKSDAVVATSGVDPMLRGIASPLDLENGGYRMYVRAQDSAGQWSAWADRAWTQNVPVPVAPTGLTAVPDDEALTTSLSVTATTGGVADLVRFECSDDAGTTWQLVDGADAVPLEATTTAVDRFPPFGKARDYRATAYSADPRTASTPSATATATLARRTYALHARNDATVGGHVNVQEPVAWTRPVVAGVFEALGDEYPTVVSDGAPKARRSTLQLVALDAAEWASVSGLVESDSVLVYRDPFGAVRYCRVVGSWTQQLMPGAVLDHRHTTELPLVEVEPPHLTA